MLDCGDLKTWLHRDFAQRDKLLITLASFDAPCQIKDIAERAKMAGFRIPRTWNPSNSLRRSKGMAIRTPKGWEITETGKQRLRKLGISKISAAAVQTAIDLRQELSNIGNSDTRSFVEEAITCYELELYRSAIVMSWVGAISVLYGHVHANHLARFNAEARRVDSKWKDAITMDDLTRMREADFLDRITALSIVGRDVKKALKNCLTRRNSCGHPNSLRIRANTVAHQVEVLLLNVFTRF